MDRCLCVRALYRHRLNITYRPRRHGPALYVVVDVFRRHRWNEMERMKEAKESGKRADKVRVIDDEITSVGVVWTNAHEAFKG